MIQKAIDTVTAEDINALVADGVRESRSIEYKLELPGQADSEKREFLADIASFVNTTGGDVLYGVEAKDGVPVSAHGLANFNEDNEILRLESTIRTGLGPRVPNLETKVVDGFPRGPVLILRCAKSWLAPHMVTYKGSSRFHARSSAGKYQMDVSELRAAFARSQDLPDRIRSWREERLGLLMEKNTPVPLDRSSMLVLHLVPVESFVDEMRFNVRELRSQSSEFRPMGSAGWDDRANIDGFLTYSGSREDHPSSSSYCQLFRSGRLEAATTRVITGSKEAPLLASIYYEQAVIGATGRYLKTMKELGVLTPIVLLLSLLGVKGVKMAVSALHMTSDHLPIDRDVIRVPELVIDDFDLEMPRVLRPAFDAIWNAAGFDRSWNFDDNGEWDPHG